jgi:hypothetical protein
MTAPSMTSAKLARTSGPPASQSTTPGVDVYALLFL